MHALYIASIWIHIVAAVTWLGGSLFLTIVFVPTVTHPDFRETGSALLQRAARRFLWVGWTCFALILLTGLFGLYYRGGLSWVLISSGEFWLSTQGHVMAGKLILFGVILTLSALHSFVLSPLAAKAKEQASPRPKAGHLLLAMRWLGRVNLVLGLIVIGLGVAFVRGWPW